MRNNLTINLATLAVEVIHSFAVVGAERRGEAFLWNVTLTRYCTVHGDLTSRSLQTRCAIRSMLNSVQRMRRRI